MIRVARPSDPHLVRMLEAHPDVVLSEELGPVTGLQFWQDGRRREVRVGDRGCPVHGLVELMDNNPMVCADAVSVPSPAGTLALIALGPLAKAGLIAEPPGLVVDFEATADDIRDWLATEGWAGEADLQVGPLAEGPVLGMTAMAALLPPADAGAIDDLYEECFGRSFFVRRWTDSGWNPERVAGSPYAYFRLDFAPEPGRSDLAGLASVRVAADREGKAGAAQVVHAMNVMAGAEESLGIAEPQPV